MSKQKKSDVPCRVCGAADPIAVKFLTRWPEEDLCPTCAVEAERKDTPHA